MKTRKCISLLSVLLSVIMLIGCLPFGVLAAGGGEGTLELDYVEYRGDGMSADANDVMVYDELKDYLVKSKKNEVLASDYKINSALTSTKTAMIVDDRYPDLTVDWAMYYDKSIDGTTVVVKYGLSEFDSVTYVDSATGKTMTGKAPRELTASNGGDVSFDAGYGVNEMGETTVHYKEKSVLFYLINHSCEARVGTESDVSILSDYIAEGYIVIVLDFKSHADAITPYIEMALVSARALFDSSKEGNQVSDLVNEDDELVSVSENYIYFLPEGYRLARDIWFYDPSIWSLNGVMEKYMEAWNSKVAGSSYDVAGIGKFASVEDMIARLKQTDGVTPVDYKCTMNVLYPSEPKDGYVSPLYMQEGSGPVKELAVETEYTRGSYMGFALNGYAAIQYDHSFHPFVSDFQYPLAATGGNYGIQNDLYNNARAAVRCARYYADAFGYSDEYIGVAGISKATIGAATLSVKNNKTVTMAVTGYDANVTVGDIFADGVASADKKTGNRLKAIDQPFMHNDDATEISSDVACTYVAAGGGTTTLFGNGAQGYYEKVPMMTTEGLRDEFGCYMNLEPLESAFELTNDSPYLVIPMLDQGHTYPVGYDDEYGYERFLAMLSFFDVYLKPDENRAPEVLWITPTDGSTDIPVSGEWALGPYTPYGREMDSYERTQKIQVRFVEAVDSDSVNYGMTVKDANGKRIDGEWMPSQNGAMYTFVTDGLEAGKTYTITATKNIVSKNGTPLAKERAVTFTTEGSYALFAVADTYVSSLAPDAVFGTATELPVEGGSIVLLSYPAASVAEATALTLSVRGIADAGASIKVYALADYKVDETILTYNRLIASAAWESKTLLGGFADLDKKQLSLDLSALSEIASLGNYVTLALVSESAAIEDPYIFEQNFNSYAVGTAVTGTDSKGATVTVIDTNGKVTSGAAETDNRIYSDYLLISGGLDPRSLHLEEVDGSMALDVYGNLARIRFFNVLGDRALMPGDIGKSFRISFRIKPEIDGFISCNFRSANAGEGTGSYTGPTSKYSAANCLPKSFDFDLDAGVWQEISFYVTVTEAMVTNQAGLLYVEFLRSDHVVNAWIDDMRSVECTPCLMLAAKESGTNLRPALVTVNASSVSFAAGELETDAAWIDRTVPAVTATTPANGAMNVALFESILLTFDKAMDVESLADGIVVTNTTSGKTATGTWYATDGTNRTFAFRTDVLAPTATYSVKVTSAAKTLYGAGCAEATIIRFSTTESCTAEPVASTQISTAEPDKSFGLDVAPTVDATTMGVLSFNVKDLASGKKIYLTLGSIDTEKVEVYGLADYTLAEDFNHRAFARLMQTRLADANAKGNVIELFADELLSLGATGTVTVILKSSTTDPIPDKYYVKDGYSIVYSKVLNADGLTYTYIIGETTGDGSIPKAFGDDYANLPWNFSQPYDATVIIFNESISQVTGNTVVLRGGSKVTDVYAESNATVLNTNAVVDYSGINKPTTLHIYSNVSYTVGNANNAVDVSYIEVENFEAKYAELWRLTPDKVPSFGEKITAALAEYNGFTAVVKDVLADRKEILDTLSAYIQYTVMEGYSIVYTKESTGDGVTYVYTISDPNGNGVIPKAFGDNYANLPWNMSPDYDAAVIILDETITEVPGNFIVVRNSGKNKITDIYVESQTTNLINNCFVNYSGGVVSTVVHIYGDMTCTVSSPKNALILSYYEAEEFDEKYAALWEMSVEQAMANKPTVLAAIREYDALPSAAQAQLAARKSILDTLSAASDASVISVISYQVTKGENGVFSLRAIAGLNSLDYANFGYEITVTNKNAVGNLVSKTLFGATTKVYSSIFGGATEYSIKEYFGYEYAGLATVTGLAVESEYTKLEIRSYVTTLDGEVKYGKSATLLYTGALDDGGYPTLSLVTE
ncbi:MAG: Ig-like domain-containing protein [Clostridia bacterium]|nr:Ig-like domain-containing protein [Clostridia bacterium]